MLEKEYIAACAPTASPTASPDVMTLEPTSSAEPNLRPMAADEIEVGGVVMKADARGTSHDPRALAEEQWLVQVRTTTGRTFRVQTDGARFAKIREGDRVQVWYRVGKYTNTIWSSGFE